jgi:hypothetical protein
MVSGRWNPVLVHDRSLIVPGWTISFTPDHDPIERNAQA